MDTPRLFIVVPCYNEEEALPITAQRLREVTDDMLQKQLICTESKIVLVDDGSKDATWQKIEEICAADTRFEGVKLAHNVGHMNALWAGMTVSAERCDALVTIDADLQDDVNAMYGFLQEYQAGADVVYGVRSSRETDTAFKRNTAQLYYKGMKRMGVDLVYNHADYRLLSRRALEALLSFGEVNMFLRGMVPMLGFKTAQVYYERSARVAGESKYPLKKMLAFAMDGVTSFSNKPIRWVLFTGVFFALLGFIMAVYTLISVASGHTVAGWASIMMSIWLIGGVQLIGIGVVGEYVGKVYLETKRRPKFILQQHIHN